MTSKKIDIIASIVTILAILGTILFMNGEALGIEKIVDEDAEQYTDTEYFTSNDLNGTWDESDATVITCNGESATVSGAGAYAYDGGVVITNAGYYVVSGTLTDGSITVDAYQSSKVFIMLAGVDITCSDDAGIRVDQADKVFLTLKEGSVNSVTSGATYTEEALSDNTGGAIYSHDDLTINGSGTLNVTAEYKHGLDVNDALTITGGTISITAVADGIHANDGTGLTGMNLTINAGDDAIHDDTEVYVADGTILIESCYEGIEAPIITVEDGEITIYPEDDGFNAGGGTSTAGFGMGGMMTPHQSATQTASPQGEAPDSVSIGADGNTREGSETVGSTATDATQDATESVTPTITINGGSVTIINETGRDADGLDSNGDIYINGGTIRVSLVNSGSNSAIDYGSESGGVCVVNGGSVIACGSYGMAEHFDETSSQPAILYNFSAGADAGTTFAIEDADGNVLVTYDVPCSYSSVNVSIPELTIGESYIVVVGDQEEEIALEEVSASYGDAASTGFGGTMNFGGMRQRGGGMTNSEITATDGTEATQGMTGGRKGGRGQGGFGGGRGDFGGGMTPPEGMTEGEMPTPPEGMTEGEMPTMPEGEMPEPPDGMTEGEMPTPPEGMTEGEMPAPPDGMTEGEMPALPDGMTEGEMPTPPQALTEEVSDTQTTDTATSITELSESARMEVGASAAVLIAGLAVAFGYRRRGR